MNRRGILKCFAVCIVAPAVAAAVPIAAPPEDKPAQLRYVGVDFFRFGDVTVTAIFENGIYTVVDRTPKT